MKEAEDSGVEQDSIRKEMQRQRQSARMPERRPRGDQKRREETKRRPREETERRPKEERGDQEETKRGERRPREETKARVLGVNACVMCTYLC